MSEQIKQKWYQSTKKTLGVVGFFLYWIVQVPAIVKDPQVIVSLTPLNLALVLGLLGIKTIGGAIANNKKEM